MSWWVENDGQSVRFRGEVSSRDDLEKLIAALSVQLPLLAKPNPNTGTTHKERDNG